MGLPLECVVTMTCGPRSTRRPHLWCRLHSSSRNKNTHRNEAENNTVDHVAHEGEESAGIHYEQRATKHHGHDDERTKTPPDRAVGKSDKRPAHVAGEKPRAEQHRQAEPDHDRDHHVHEKADDWRLGANHHCKGGQHPHHCHHHSEYNSTSRASKHTCSNATSKRCRGC